MEKLVVVARHWALFNRAAIIDALQLTQVQLCARDILPVAVCVGG